MSNMNLKPLLPSIIHYNSKAVSQVSSCCAKIIGPERGIWGEAESREHFACSNNDMNTIILGVGAGGRERKVREEGGKPELFCKDVIHASLVLRAYPN